MKLPEQICTARLVVSRLAPTDKRDFVAFLTDPAAVEFMFTDAQKSVVGAQHFLEQLISSYATETPYFVLVMSLADSAEFLGICGVSGLPDKDALELLCCVLPRYRRKGYATEALRGLMEHCSAQCGVNEFRAYINLENRRSSALAERLGMRFVGRAPHPNHGDDSNVYSAKIASHSG